MTVPLQRDAPNVVVGRSLREFLALGCHHGYLGLEQLAYSYESTVADLAEADAVLEEDQRRVLTYLRNRMGLSPWPDLPSRLADLQALLPTIDVEGTGDGPRVGGR